MRRPGQDGNGTFPCFNHFRAVDHHSASTLDCQRAPEDPSGEGHYDDYCSGRYLVTRDRA
jgi:hypothetical protein